ncbi:Pyridoxal-dependent decarboxylase conserved domain [seawater metagenome]|uniref:Pyridoxal-dependent decarboxylase conserved domain n=1 Tax=seawater metagenome TaxID=1561972 RepID=A0A5E8CJ69_9ZZZZ
MEKYLEYCKNIFVALLKKRYNHDFVKGSFFTILLLFSYKYYLKQKKRFNLLSFLQKLPYINKNVNNQIDSAKRDIQDQINNGQNEYINSLPENGLDELEIISKINNISSTHVQKGHISGVVYHGGEEYTNFLLRVFKKFAWANPLHFDLFPEIRKMEIEIVKMAINMFQGNEKCCGNVTYGGTESILLACKTYREWGFDEKGIDNPNIVLLESGHSAFKKAGHYFNIEIKTVPINYKTGTTTIENIIKYVDKNTVCIVGSAPAYAHGIIDPIFEIANYGKKNNIGVHVDCCMGGFLLPFLRTKINDIFDFSIPGVTSISADTHKYGYALKGSSIIMYRDQNLKKYQHFSHSDWNGGIYATPTIMGSKSGALIASAWAAMMYHGFDKYQEIATKIMEATERIKEAVKDLQEIEIIGNPKINIIAFNSETLNIYKLSSCLTEMGWHLNILQNPASFHFCITYIHISDNTIIDKFINDLKESIINVQDGQYDNIEGTAALYGMASSINQQSVTGEIVNSYIHLLSTDNII